MAKSRHPSESSSKSKSKNKKRKKLSSQAPPPQSLSNVCNVTGLDADIGGMIMGTNGGGSGDDIMDCLDAMATKQVDGTSALSTVALDSSTAKKTNPQAQPPSPPGIDHIPNLRIELARHLHTQNLSTFLLKSVPGQLRMPTFERWLLDSKLEETDRYQSIVGGWIDNPLYKVAFTDNKTKKKYGRAAMYQQQKDSEGISAQYEMEKSRMEKECKLLLEAEKCMPSRSTNNNDVGNWIRHVERDPILSHSVLDSDLSSDRLLKEIMAAMMSSNNTSAEESTPRQYEKEAKEVVRDLCHRTTEAAKELHQMSHRLGRYQKFAWDNSSAGIGKKKKKKRKLPGGSNNVDKVDVEWHEDNKLCSLIYVPKKRKLSRPKSTTGGFRNVHMGNEKDGEEDDATSTPSSHNNKPKPFVVKLNATHYHKLRAMFDATHESSTASKSNEQATYAFHAVLFATVIRYSSLSGGQQLNDWRGGGMQGAINEGVFDCLSKWFGPSVGTECFASPFNCILPRYYSAFPSPDLDGFFGSSGDFLFNSSSFLSDGWYELNPPFTPGIMAKMAQRIEKLMEHTKHLNVTFVVIIPTVRDASTSEQSPNDSESKKTKKEKKRKKKERKHPSGDNERGQSSNSTHLMSAVNEAAAQSFYQLINSPYCKSHIILQPREHGYIEGSQHLRPTKYKESQYSTSVIVLRSKSLSTNDAESFEADLRLAFASQHTAEIKKRTAG